MQDIVLLGAGGQAKDLLKNIEEYNDSVSAGKRFNILGCLDDTPPAHKELAGYEVLHSMDIFDKKAFRPAQVICAVGDPVNKKIFVKKAAARGLRFFNIIHPSVKIHSSCRLGTGISIFSNSVISSFCRLGDHAAVNYLCSINHDCSVGDFATIAPGVKIGGNCAVGEGAFLGLNSCVINGIDIKAWSVVGAGTTVIKDVDAYTVVAGNPSRVIGRRDENTPVI